ncbi:hypothetical protein NC652_016300 [Populus alba x Populus x berolinensis]|nr:hypothetical protein NC652_016300 [Populus alba x Populus x berolinensis]
MDEYKKNQGVAQWIYGAHEKKDSSFCVDRSKNFQVRSYSRKPSTSATESEADWHFSKFPTGKSFTTSTWVGVWRASWVTISLQNIYFDDVGLTMTIQK